MSDHRQRQGRPGLDPVPGRVPPLPRAPSSVPRPVAPVETPQASATERPRRGAPTVATQPSGRGFRPREFQLDKEARDWIDTTTLSIRLRTETGFDRSALLRGLLRGVRESGLELAANCGSEEEVAAYVLLHLPRGSA